MTSSNILNVLLIIGMVMGALSYAAATFRANRQKTTAAALSTALQEVEAVQHKADRLEEEVALLRQENVEQRQEMAIMRGIIGGGGLLSDALTDLIRSEFASGLEPIIAAIEGSSR